MHSLGQGKDSRDRIVVSTLRCGRSNPGSNPGHGKGEVFYEYFKNILFRLHLINMIYFTFECKIGVKASDMKYMVLTKYASAGNRTRINCLEGSYADHYTTDADVGLPRVNVW